MKRLQEVGGRKITERNAYTSPSSEENEKLTEAYATCYVRKMVPPHGVPIVLKT